MAVLPIAKVKEVTTRAFEELQLPVGASEEQVVSRFRTICLSRVLSHLPTETSDSTVKVNAIDDGDEGFQRQAVAYRFLCSLPLLSGVEYRAEHLLPKLRPLDPQANDNEIKERASAMLDVTITSMERAQKAGHLPYTNFVLRVHYCFRRHVVRRRYSEFLALHSLLEAKLPVLPQLPERNWVYALQMPPAERAQRLASYLQRVTTLLAARGVFSLEVMAFLEIDVTRVRGEEEALAVDILSRASRSAENIFFIVQSSWISSWKRFVTTHKLHPGPITNHNLLEATSRHPKEDLVAAKHYRCVNSSTWRYWHLIYGGGPAIRRQTPSIYGQPACDPATLAILIQRLVRGFLARLAMQRARIQQKLEDPATCQMVAAKARHRTLEARLDVVRQYVEVREFQTRHVAAMKIQRTFRMFLIRAEHALLLAESAVPDSATTQGLQQLYDDRLALEELALVEDPALRLAHFLATMLAGVPLRKLRSRNKIPAWRLFRLDSIASELRWSSSVSTKTNTMAFTDVKDVTMETPLATKGPSLMRRMGVIGSEDGAAQREFAGNTSHAVVVTYHEGGVMRELMLICEGPGEMEVLYFGLRALVSEVSSRTADGATFVDGHGIIRKRVPHAKKLLREAHELLEKKQHKAQTQEN